jgi:hypothetical protein
MEPTTPLDPRVDAYIDALTAWQQEICRHGLRGGCASIPQAYQVHNRL